MPGRPVGRSAFAFWPTRSDVNDVDIFLLLSQVIASCHRVLIFCQFKSMLDFIEEQLFKKALPSVSYLRLDGGVPVNQVLTMSRQDMYT